MKCKICEQECEKEICGWCENRINEFKSGNESHSVINIVWGFGRIGWSEAYFLRDFLRENNIKEVLEFGTGLSTEIFVLLGMKVISCDILKNHLDLFSKLSPLRGGAEFIWYPDSQHLPNFEKLYPNKKWDLVFVDGPQERTNETEVAKSLSNKFIYLHDPGLSQQKLDMGPEWKQMNGSYLFKKYDPK